MLYAVSAKGHNVTPSRPGFASCSSLCFDSRHFARLLATFCACHGRSGGPVCVVTKELKQVGSNALTVSPPWNSSGCCCKNCTECSQVFHEVSKHGPKILEGDALLRRIRCPSPRACCWALGRPPVSAWRRWMLWRKWRRSSGMSRRDQRLFLLLFVFWGRGVRGCAVCCTLCCSVVRSFVCLDPTWKIMVFCLMLLSNPPTKCYEKVTILSPT